VRRRAQSFSLELHSHCSDVNFSRYRSRTHQPDTPFPAGERPPPPSLPPSLLPSAGSIGNSTFFFLDADARTAICLCAYVHRNVKSAAASFMVSERRRDSACSCRSILESAVDPRPRWWIAGIRDTDRSDDAVNPRNYPRPIADCVTRRRSRFRVRVIH